MKTEAQLKKVVSDVVAHIHATYGIAVVWRDLSPGVTGDLDGEEIVLDSKNDPETELYVLLHLFGHTCQWNTSEALRKLGYERPSHITVQKLAEIRSYEQSASRIGLTLLNELGYGDLREWLSRFFAADWTFLEELYTTGRHIEAQVQWDTPVDLLDPLPVPDFRCHKFEHRQAFD